MRDWWGLGVIIPRQNELRDLEAQMLYLVCHNVEVEPVLQEITGESLGYGGVRDVFWNHTLS